MKILMRVKYFAYGTNMSPAVISEICPTHKFLGRARLENHRLAFTRKSLASGSGSADIVRLPGMTVWGALYEIDEKEIANLDKIEGYGSAYTRTEISVFTEGRVAHYAITYTVITKESSEIAPSQEYVETMLEGARSCRLPKYYVDFLESLQAEDKDRFREGFLVLGTESRAEARGMGLVKLSSTAARKAGLGKFAAVVYRDRACLVRVAHLDTLDHHTCQLDQSIRHALGFPGSFSYGLCVTLHPVLEREWNFPFVEPRSLTLPLRRPNWLDSEKKICVLHESNIRLLGLAEGEYVVVSAIHKEADGRFRVLKCSMRVFSRPALQIKKKVESSEKYPRVDAIYLDLDGRTMLGLPRGVYHVPVTIAPDIWRLFTGRLLYYGITLSLGMVAILPFIHELVSIFRASQIFSLGVTFLVSILFTLVLCFFDMRGKVQY